LDLGLFLLVLLGVSWERLGGHHTAGQDIEPDPQDPYRVNDISCKLIGTLKLSEFKYSIFIRVFLEEDPNLADWHFG
jgi:hypothetical protein